MAEAPQLCGLHLLRFETVEEFPEETPDFSDIIGGFAAQRCQSKCIARALVPPGLKCLLGQQGLPYPADEALTSAKGPPPIQLSPPYPPLYDRSAALAEP